MVDRVTQTSDFARLKGIRVLSTVVAVRTPNGAAVVLIAAAATVTWVHAVGQEQASKQGRGAETLTVCKLLANAQNDAGQTVTLNANFVSNFEFSALTDASCQPKPTEANGKPPLIQPHFDSSSYDHKSPLAKKLNKLLKKEDQARVILIGVFIDPGGYFGHQLCCRYRLDVSKIVSVEQVTVEK
jgi:hypothetical protein